MAKKWKRKYLFQPELYTPERTGALMDMLLSAWRWSFFTICTNQEKTPVHQIIFFFNYWLYNNNYLSSIILKITKSRNTDFWSVNKNILPCKFLREHYGFVSQISHRFGCGTRSGQDTFGTWNNIIGSLINKFNPKCLNSIIRHRRNFVKHHIFMYFQ